MSAYDTTDHLEDPEAVNDRVVHVIAGNQCFSLVGYD